MTYAVNFEKIRDTMLQKNISIRTLASAMEISPSSLSRKLNGVSEFTIGESQKLSAKLEVNPADVFFTSLVPNPQQKPI